MNIGLCVAFYAWISLLCYSQAMSIRGSITATNATNKVIVQCFQLTFNTDQHKPVFLSQYTLFDPTTVPFKTVELLPNDLTYQITNLPPGNYSIYAFEDINGNGKVSLYAQMGWWGNDIVAGRLSAIELSSSDYYDANFSLKRSHPYSPAQGKRGGVIKQIKGYNILQLKGSMIDRGYDHGYLAAQQIIDWFRYYVLEQLIPPKDYLTSGQDFLQKVMTIDDEFKTEGNAVIQGMQDSGVDMKIPELSREFNLIDLFAINSYIELGNFASSCTQFVVWGNQTVDGNLIAARNMDGECDVRKITVSHLTLFAVQPSEPNQHRYISIMWPGFLGTLTAFNEFGLYSMMNTGRCARGNQVSNAKPVSWSLRHVIDTLTSDNASPDQTQKILNQFSSSGGGISTSGTIFVFAREYNSNNNPPAYIYEGDKYGGMMRLPYMVSPKVSTCIMASNHFRVYGVDPFNPDFNFGLPISFDSHNRYTTGEESLLAWNRTSHALTRQDLINLLQRVAHGSTEHSVIWTPHDRKFLIANSKMEPTSWDAPYEQWTEFKFDDIFE